MTTITIPRALLEQALEAFQHITKDGTGKSGKQIVQDLCAVEASIRAELAKPEQEESFIPDWANYRQGVADGKAGNPKWHDAPTEPGLWVRAKDGCFGAYSIHESAIPILKWSEARWYGPIPQDGEGS